MAITEEPNQRAGASGREAARQLRNVRSLADMTAEIAAAHDFTTTARLLLLTMLGALSATRGAVWLYDPEEAALRPSAARGVEVGDELLPLPTGAAQSLKSAAAPLPLAAAHPDRPLLATVGGRWPELLLAVPLVAREELLGLLAVGAKLNRQPYSEGELELLFTLATMAASGFHSHNLIAGLQEANRRLIETQEQLIRAEQLATLGSTAAGIAHEIGNPLTSIAGYAITIRDMAGEITPERLQEFIEPIVNESERLRQILEELKDYAKPKGYELAAVALSAVVEDTLNFTRYDPLFRNRLEVRRVYEADPVVLLNQSKIKQVLLNLLKNAAQAMEGQERPPFLEVRVRAAGEVATVSVRDHGPGIRPDRLDRIWEPFFTTKGSVGTGLGLDLCKQIVERHGGAIQVESAVGVGTTFTIRLPVPGGEQR